MYMLPLGHLVVGYAAFSVFERAVRREPPTATALPWLLFGTQFPDLIDKPLAWGFGILPAGRSLAHSLLFAVPVAVVVGVELYRRDRVISADGFLVGYGSHLLTDVFTHIEEPSFLLWPVLPAPVYESERSGNPLPTLAELSTGMLVELLLGVLVVVLWILDGAPGLAEVRLALERMVRRS